MALLFPSKILKKAGSKFRPQLREVRMLCCVWFTGFLPVGPPNPPAQHPFSTPSGGKVDEKEAQKA